tara:strand:- start:1927 stop:2532 length:606 start_codon:yes stop_codon:yes gene_type:complete
MIPRIEQKLEIDKSSYINIVKWLKFKNAEILYPERLVISRYFDNHNLQMYYDTHEGLLPRKKIRLRTYNTRMFEFSDFPYNLEKKLTTEGNRYKSIEKDVLLNENHQIFDEQYGLCTQKVDISYIREYFLINSIRLTIDKDITYKNLNSLSLGSTMVEDKKFVLEVKADINTDMDLIYNTFDFPRSRFSKYERSFEYLFKI